LARKPVWVCPVRDIEEPDEPEAVGSLLAFDSAVFDGCSEVEKAQGMPQPLVHAFPRG
jgi:hypothetical protein